MTPHRRGMLGLDSLDEFPDFEGFRPPARRSQIDTFDHKDVSHLLDDPTIPGDHGGHRWPGASGKTPFPQGWGIPEVEAWIGAIIDNPAMAMPRRNGKPGFNLSGSYDGVKGIVFVRPIVGVRGRWYIATAYPTE